MYMVLGFVKARRAVDSLQVEATKSGELHLETSC